MDVLIPAVILTLCGVGLLFYARGGRLPWQRRWVEPLPGEMYLLDDRLVTVSKCDVQMYGVLAGDVWGLTPSGERFKVTARYWHDRARPAASQPGRMMERVGGGGKVVDLAESLRIASGHPEKP